MHAGYYEAILQVRPRRKEVESFISEKFANTSKARVSRKKVVKTGADYYVSSWKFAMSLGNDLVKRFGGVRLVSTKIYGKTKKKGRIVYRCTVLYRSFSFKKGSVVAHEGKIYQITSTGKKVTGENLVTGKREEVNPKVKWAVLKALKAQVSSNEPVQVIDPHDYQSKPVQNLKKTKDVRIKVVAYRERVYSVN